MVDCFVDGSAAGKISSYGFIILEKDKEIYRQSGIIEGEINKIWSVGAEITAVKEAITYCKSKDYKAILFFDMKGLYCWICDLFNKYERPWRVKNKFTKEYREFIKQNRHYIQDWQKVKAHTGDNRWNEEVHFLSINTLQGRLGDKITKISKKQQKLNAAVDLLKNIIDCYNSIKDINFGDYIIQEDFIKLNPLIENAENFLNNKNNIKEKEDNYFNYKNISL
ncbi:MAG: hypothetical protein AABY22_26125 [Nanoarchaeota archaeon]